MNFFCDRKLNLLSFILFTLCVFAFNSNAQTYDINLVNTNHINSERDSIKTRTKYWTSLNLNHIFFIVDSTEFYRNQVLTLTPNTRRFRSYTMTLKFYPYQDLEIKYNPTLFKEQILYEERGFLKLLESSKTYANSLSPIFDIKKKYESFFIEQPELVKYVWKTIPEPHRLITDRRRLNKRTAKEGIEGLLVRDVDSRQKLNKRIKAKGPWTLSGVENIQLSQAYLANWTKGGENSLALQSDLLLRANYKEGKNEWENFIRHKVGVISTESYAAQINTDQIEINSKYGLRASKKWYYSALFDFKSQFFNGYNNKDREEIISGFLSPAYFTFALGMDFKKDKDFTLLLSPFTSKLTYVMDTVKVDQTRYISDNSKTAFNNGASLVNDINWKISTELSLKSHLDAFIGYFSKDAITQIDWEIIFDMRINRYLSTRVNTQFRYFTNESNKVQFREYFAINFNYKF
ncbi:DUF3078 domain-containing protein [Labilibacter sediminis]|nr:DUF3078 domain-containing protein [Labilibacter sediminis]